MNIFTTNVLIRPKIELIGGGDTTSAAAASVEVGPVTPLDIVLVAVFPFATLTDALVVEIIFGTGATATIFLGMERTAVTGTAALLVATLLVARPAVPVRIAELIGIERPSGVAVTSPTIGPLLLDPPPVLTALPPLDGTGGGAATVIGEEKIDDWLKASVKVSMTLYVPGET